MKIVGGWLIGIGVFVALASLFLSTSIDTPTSTYLGEFGSSRAVYNLGLLQVQGLLFQAGLATLLCGVIVLCSGLICEHISALMAAGSATSAGADEGVQAPKVMSVDIAAHAQSPTPTPSDEAQDRLAWGLIACIVVVGVVAAVLFWAAPTTSSPELATVEANADALADNMEMMADNLQALADNMAFVDEP